MSTDDSSEEPFRKTPTPPRRRSYRASLTLGYLYTATSAVSNLVLVPVLLHSLGTRKFGIWLTLFALAQWLSMLASWPAPAVVKMTGEALAGRRADAASTILASISVTYAVISLIVMGVAVYLSTRRGIFFLGGEFDRDVRGGIVLAGLWVAARVQSQVRINLLTAAQRLYMAHAIQTVVLIVSTTGAIIAVSLGGRLSAVLAAYGMGAVTGLVLLVIATRRLSSMRWSPRHLSGKILTSLVRQGAPYALSGGSWILFSSDLLLLAFLAGPVVVSTYGVAYKLVESVVQLVWRVSDSTQPYIVEFDALGHRESLQRLHAMILQVSVAVGVSVAVFLWIVGPQGIALWVGQEQAPSASLVRLLAVYLALQSFLHVQLVFPFFAGRMTSISWIQLIEGVGKVALAILLVPRLRSEGMVWASLIAMTSTSLWFIPRYSSRWLGTEGSTVLMMTLRSLLPPMVTGVVAWGTLTVIDAGSPVGLATASLLSLFGFALGAVVLIRTSSDGLREWIFRRA